VSRPVSPAELAAELGPDGEGLLSTGSVGALRVLLLAHGRRRTSCADAVVLLRTHHTGAPGALDTARLLVTDRRWDRLTGRLVRDLVGTGLLSEADLDSLARELLADEFLHYRLDARTFGEEVVILLPGPDGEQEVEEEQAQEEEAAAASELIARRRIRPPLRRWAAARAAERSLTPIAELLALADDLPARDAAEAVRGVVDTLDSLPPRVAEPLLELALTWPARSVRRSALQHLVARGEQARAWRLAAADSDETVRKTFADRDEQASLF